MPSLTGKELCEHNRIFKMPEDMLNKFTEYVEGNKDGLLSAAGFCKFADIGKTTYYSYAKRPEFEEVKEWIDTCIEDRAIEIGGKAKNPAFTIFFMKNACGYTDKTEITQKDKSDDFADLPDETLDEQLAEAQRIEDELNKSNVVSFPNG